jgi:hypothetical protein
LFAPADINPGSARPVPVAPGSELNRKPRPRRVLPARAIRAARLDPLQSRSSVLFGARIELIPYIKYDISALQAHRSEDNIRVELLLRPVFQADPICASNNIHQYVLVIIFHLRCPLARTRPNASRITASA